MENRIAELKHDLAADDFCMREFFRHRSASAAFCWFQSARRISARLPLPSYRTPATLRAQIFLCGASTRPRPATLGVLLSVHFLGRLQQRIPLLENVLTYRPNFAKLHPEPQPEPKIGHDLHKTQFNFGIRLIGPTASESVLVTQHNNFEKSERLPGAATRLAWLLTSEGVLEAERKLVQPAFHQERIAAYTEVMVAHTERMVASWKDVRGSTCTKPMMRLTLDIVAKTLFDTDVSREAEDVGAALQF